MNTNKVPISIVSNIFHPVGPAVKGGLEVFNYYLTKELEERDRDTELWASGESYKLKSLRLLTDKALEASRTQEFLSIPWNYRRLTVEEFMIYTDFIQKQKNNRLLHFSLVNFLPIYLAIKKNLPMILTLHMPLTNLHYEALQKLLTPEELRKVHFIGISHSQIKNWPHVYDIVHNGVALEDFSFSDRAKDSLVWIGRFVKEKACGDAIAASQKAKSILEIAGAPHSNVEQDYFKKIIKPAISHKIKYQGFIQAKERSDFYAGKALLFTSKWDEPFGLVMVEAMACGTPIITYNNGAAKEIIKDGETGFLVKSGDIDGLVKAIKKIENMSENEYQAMRQKCRQHVEENFTVEKMVDNYEKIYEKVVEDWKKKI